MAPHPLTKSHFSLFPPSRPQGGGEDRDGGLGVSGRVVYTQQIWKGVITDERDPQVL
jgi:hypothetical protein